jgi:uncharacterized protein Usg
MFDLRQRTIVTLQVLYWMPDYSNILQEFIWQTKDVTPEYPRIHKFLDYWHKEIEAVISEVNLAESGRVTSDYRRLKFTERLY